MKIQKLFIEIIFFIFSTTRFNSLNFFYVWAFYCFRKICLHFDNFERTLNSGGYEGRSDRGPLIIIGFLTFLIFFISEAEKQNVVVVYTSDQQWGAVASALAQVDEIVKENKARCLKKFLLNFNKKRYSKIFT